MTRVAGEAANPFCGEADWLERRRIECLRDLDHLKRQLDTVAAAPWEDRPAQMNSILRQAAGAYRTIARIDNLRTWVTHDPDR